MKTMEERIKEIKHCGECAIYSMGNHQVVYLPYDGSFVDIINAMHDAQTKDKLSEAYYKYINLCINHGYSDGEIIGGIMQNTEQNERFNVNIDSVIKSLIEIKYTTVKLAEPVIQQSNHADRKVEKEVNKTDETAGGVKINDKIIKKIKAKMNYAEGVLNTLNNNKSENVASDINKIKTVVNEIYGLVASIDPTSCNEEEIAELNDISAKSRSYLKLVSEIKKANTDTKIADDNQASSNQTNVVQQASAAHTEGGFSIANFIKQQPIKGPNMPTNNQPSQLKQSVFPHQICGLTDEQIVEEVKKHFEFMNIEQSIPAYALYDLINNKFLTRKMKEFNAKQRANNPRLTQVNINEYIDIPELLAKYSLCFTIPCNDKNQIIVVLFNPIAVPDTKTGILQYPLHVIKAAKTNNNK